MGRERRARDNNIISGVVCRLVSVSCAGAEGSLLLWIELEPLVDFDVDVDVNVDL